MAEITRPEVKGDIAHDSANTTTSFPVKTGGVAYDFDGTALPTAVAEADVTDGRYTRDGRALVELGHPHYFQTIAAYAAAQTNASLIAAPAAGLSLYITDIRVNAEVNAAGGHIRLLDDLTSTGEKIRFQLPTTGSEGQQLRQPIKLTAAKALGITTTMTATSVFVAGYTAP